jgi:hypothetical protein
MKIYCKSESILCSHFVIISCYSGYNAASNERYHVQRPCLICFTVACKPGLTRVQTTMRRAELAGAGNG